MAGAADPRYPSYDAFLGVERVQGFRTARGRAAYRMEAVDRVLIDSDAWWAGTVHAELPACLPGVRGYLREDVDARVDALTREAAQRRTAPRVPRAPRAFGPPTRRSFVATWLFFMAFLGFATLAYAKEGSWIAAALCLFFTVMATWLLVAEVRTPWRPILACLPDGLHISRGREERVVPWTELAFVRTRRAGRSLAHDVHLKDGTVVPVSGIAGWTEHAATDVCDGVADWRDHYRPAPPRTARAWTPWRDAVRPAGGDAPAPDRRA